MDRAKAERILARRKFTLCAQKLEKLLDSCDEFIPAEFEKLNKLFEDLTLVQNKVVSVWLDDDSRDEETFDKDIVEADVYESRYYMLKQKASKTFISSAKSTVKEMEAEQLSLRTNGNRHFKLPRLELPRYNGEIKTWLKFWSQFKKIHMDDQIDDDDKFHYLLQCMEVGSVAREFLESFPPSGENYSIAIEQLKYRFAKDEMIIEYYVRELLNLVLAQAKGVQKGSIRRLYDSLTTQILALESMGVTQEKYSAFLLPLVESALPEETLKAWIRSQANDRGNEKFSPLSRLLNFVKSEVESEERIRLSRFKGLDNYCRQDFNISSAACLNTTYKDTKKRLGEGNQYDRKEKTCIWCDRLSHTSSECASAIGKNLEERKEFLKSKNACYICLNIGHSAKRCRKYPKCVICTKRHFPLMCSDIKKSIAGTTIASTSQESQSVLNQSDISNNKTVLLQTLRVKICNGDENITVRVLLDSGAQQTFVTKDVASRLKLKACGMKEMSQNLFGGATTQKKMYRIYNLNVRSLDDTYECYVRAYEQNIICGDIPHIKKGSNILSILNDKGVVVTDSIDDVSKIDLLIGSDFLGTLLTGRSVRVDDYLFATETKLGWTVQGPAVSVYCSSESVSVLTCSYTIEDFWNLETLDIKDNAQEKSLIKREEEIDNFFKDTIQINEDFLLALRRFLARRGAVKLIYSDNGTNFRGATHIINEINWQEISSQTLTQKIEWRFMPPSAPWWGGFWERMVRTVKDILCRILGKASQSYCDLNTILCGIENMINSRTLTYIAESSGSLITLTPATFLKVDENNLRVILNIYPDIDGCPKVAKLKTPKSECIRPIQRLYALEVEPGEFAEIKSNTHSVDTISKISEQLPRVTRTGRLVKIPNRLDL
ncbi:uncharacterized protein LOC128200046 [Galleria mellonella]|uniref:Uncharacterized protein LOC128200046 n=1 Tax=Galleria mellonella TaxID=7137 RepID=A0ABM3M9F0_GALME|nr:uncharacterized protein LOC128200046 [Galleria mellonella]